jgi:hypothetical protein
VEEGHGSIVGSVATIGSEQSAMTPLITSKVERVSALARGKAQLDEAQPTMGRRRGKDG